ncbi:pilin [Candidatus Gracilibacteria bacterium]|nr:pilin [Candidatus Gracilibacteria bacterium]
MKQYFFIILGIFYSHVTFALTSDELKATLVGDDDSIVKTTDRNGNILSGDQTVLDRILAFIRDGIFELLFAFALIVFLYIGFKLIIARGNPEEFKKTLNSFVYAVLGLFIIAFAWAAVRLVAGLSI